MHKARRSAVVAVFAFSSLLATSGSARATDSFLQSDDYQEGEAIHGVFLKDDDYRVMVESLTRNDTSFDWGWVLTPGFQDSGPPPEDTRAKALRWIPKRKTQKLEQEPHELAFDLKASHTVFIPPVANFAGIMKAELLTEIRDNFIEGTKMFGLEVVQSRDGADLELALATLDQMREVTNVPVYNITIQPFLLIELQLVDVKTGQKLVLLRNRKHGQTVADAALNFADDFVKFLR